MPELNSHGVNAAIEYHVLPDDEMRAIGFTQHREGYWYFCHNVSDDGLVTINVGFPAHGGTQDDLRIDVLDEMFCQPYDYQSIIASGGRVPYALSVMERVESTMAYLSDSGVISGHEYGEYI